MTPYAFGANRTGPPPQTDKITMVECTLGHSASNESQLTVQVGQTVVVLQADGEMLLVQVVEDGKQVGLSGWIPKRCAAITQAQVGQLECNLLQESLENQQNDAVLLRAKLSQTERTLDSLQSGQMEEVAAVRSQAKRQADERVDEERVKCAKTVEEYAGKLEEASREKVKMGEEMEELRIENERNIKAAELEWREKERVLKESSQRRMDGRVEELNNEWQAKMEQQEDEFEDRLAAAEEEFESKLAILS
eukprot:TRINITY_DN56866_c0_g1_i1.p1 TRINITY_DN56866_c0_g1~~TRINITY_DN56866_c0_g1_i1.p1  ORF type:complete len:250 (+),score=82.40 TRINITY_DN56866_c0_g1_i1:221-970(+)